MPRYWKQAGVAAALGCVALVPLFAGDFQLFRLTNVLIYAIALLGMNILTGYNGQVSLGHGAFYAIGAYTCALLVVHAGVPHWIAVPAAGLVCLGCGILFGLPLLGLDTVHLAMATFAFGAVLPGLAKHASVARWTGGAQGLGMDVPAAPFGLPLSFDQWLYLLTLVLLAAGYVLSANLLRGRIGRAVVAIRDHPIAAQAAGVDNVFYKSAIFGLSAMFTGIAGALAALAIRYVAPGMFGSFLSFGLLIGIAVGGLGALWGALYGAIFLQFIFVVVGLTARSLQTWNLSLIYGVTVILFLCFFPRGIAGLVSEAALRWRRARR